jgi:hypothetical protein
MLVKSRQLRRNEVHVLPELRPRASRTRAAAAAETSLVPLMNVARQVGTNLSCHSFDVGLLIGVGLER